MQLSEKTFNRSQLQAIGHTSGPAMILAGPGSGKTTVMLSRIEKLIKSGVNPENILAVTFSKAAALEMQERFNSQYAAGTFWTNGNGRTPVAAEKKQKGSVPPKSAMPTFGTFHSIFLKILSQGSDGQKIKIISERQKTFFIRSEIERYAIQSVDVSELTNSILNEISKCKSSVKERKTSDKSDNLKNLKESDTQKPDANIAGLPDGYFQRIYASYEKRKSAAFLIDFDDIILMCHSLLINNADLLRKCQEKFRYICIDEFQDISPAQYETIRLIAGREANIFAVGDDDQSIYGFRGASPQMMQQFMTDYPNAVKILLDVNYRCSPSIVKASLNVIGENEGRFYKDISSGVAYSDAGPVRVLAFPDRFSQFNSICQEIMELLHKDLIKGTGNEISSRDGTGSNTFLKERQIEIAVLFRNNADTELFIQALKLHKIPYTYQGKELDLFNTFIFRDIMCYMKLADMFKSGTTSGMRASLLPIINKPSRFILRDSLKMADGDCFRAMRRFYAHNPDLLASINALESHIHFLSDLEPFAGVKYICKVIGYERYLKELADEKHIEFDEYADVLGQIEDYGKMAGSLGQFIGFAKNQEQFNPSDGVNGEMEKFLKAAGKACDKNACNENVFIEIKPVNVNTLHGSKGLEYDIVYLPDVNDGILPYSRSIKEGNTDEERRLFYVGMTRAKRSLRVSYCESRNAKKAVPSRFLDCLTQ